MDISSVLKLLTFVIFLTKNSMASCGSKVLEHSPQNHNVKHSIPAITADTEREKTSNGTKDEYFALRTSVLY
jgi:hypothetical protein